MWFKQIQLFQVLDSFNYSIEEWIAKLNPLLFRNCLPSLPQSVGWVPPLEEDSESPLVQSINGCIMLCMQVEEKILPAAVVRQELQDKIKQIEIAQDRKVRQKEKLSLKEELVLTLLPRALSKYTRIYAYIDTKNHWLVLGTNSEKRTELFISLLKKSLTEKIHPFELKKLAPIMTHWIKDQHLPSPFNIEKSCILQDSKQKNRIIRCQQQNLFAESILSLVNDGCEVKSVALNWQDCVNLTLATDFSMRSLKFQDAVLAEAKDLEAETRQQQFNADFLIMTQVLAKMLQELLDIFMKESDVLTNKSEAQCIS